MGNPTGNSLGGSSGCTVRAAAVTPGNRTSASESGTITGSDRAFTFADPVRTAPVAVPTDERVGFGHGIDARIDRTARCTGANGASAGVFVFRPLGTNQNNLT